ncbi:MAG: hypothetical protein HOJ79_00030 [Nitrospina sp.]|nr:hypothetical protein [Nitrospina sp.]
MFWIDLGLLGITAYRMVSALKAAFTLAEKLALTFLFALGLKSLILFFLIWVGVRPYASIQVGAVLLVLILTLRLRRSESASSAPSADAEWQTVLACLLIGALFLFSLVNAWFFPITESDAAWYQVKSLSFLHEVRFDSEWIVPQLKQYPPFVPLLFSWFIAFGIEPIRMIFPFFYLALNIIFYCRVLEFTRNSKMAAMLTLVLGTTPYIWWHGVLPFLDLCTAVFYSAGALYWFFWMDSVDQEKARGRTLAFLSGLFFGLAAWVRLEFLLYSLIPIAMTLCAESTKDGRRDRKAFLLFFLPLLIFPTIWFLNLISFDFSVSANVKMVGLAGVFAWVAVLVFMIGSWKLQASTLIKVGILVGIIFTIFISMDSSGPVPGWKRLAIAFYRSLTVHSFYLFTAFLAIFIFLSRLKNIPSLNKLFGLFMVFYLLVHFAIFSYSPPKWGTFGEYVSATFIHPGNLVNLSDTRGVMSMYPLLLFFIASIPAVRRGFDDV